MGKDSTVVKNNTKGNSRLYLFVCFRHVCMIYI